MQRADRPTGVTTAFLAYSNRVQHTGATERAIECVHKELGKVGWDCYDWQIHHGITSVGQTVRQRLQGSDVLILDGTAISPNVAFEMGFAQAANLPVVTIKCYGSPDLPEDYGHRPFEILDDDPPVRRYDGWDRAPQMVSKVQALAPTSATSGCQVRLTRSIIWRSARRTHPYDVIFGSLIFHFMVDATAAETTMGEFFHECVRRLRPGGSLVLADVFPADDEGQRAAQLARWSDWMCGDEGGLEPSEVTTFLKGNQDMVNAPSPERVIAAALAHGLSCEADKAVSSSELPFRILVFRSPEAEGR